VVHTGAMGRKLVGVPGSLDGTLEPNKRGLTGLEAVLDLLRKNGAEATSPTDPFQLTRQ
jgi:hypothetical protein